MNQKGILILLVAVMFLIGCAEEDQQNNMGEGDGGESLQELSVYLDNQVSELNIPALSLLLFNSNEILLEYNTGLANIEKNESLSADHLFLMASISKTVTATALMTLYDQGRFDLGDGINDYLPFEVSAPGYDTDITFEMLLTHSSSIADGDALDDQYYYGEDSPVALGSFLKDYLSKTGQYYDSNQNFKNFEPGAGFHYTNIGSALIGYLVEVISGTSFDTYCADHLFAPIGMSNTVWRIDAAQHPLAMPYNNESGSNEPVGQYSFTDYPNGGLRSNTRDMHRFVSMLTNGGTIDGSNVISSSTIDQILKPQLSGINDEVGYHFFLMDAENGLWGHDGSENGTSTYYMFHPEQKKGVIVLANSEAPVEDIAFKAISFL